MDLQILTRLEKICKNPFLHGTNNTSLFFYHVLNKTKQTNTKNHFAVQNFACKNVF